MKFLANENFPVPSIREIRNYYEVISIYENLSGLKDEAVIDLASREGLIILAFDSDYGELIFKHNASDPPAVVYFRFKGTQPKQAGTLLLDLIWNQGIQLERHFTVLEEGGIRQRTY